MKMQNNKAFSMVELAIVVMVIALLTITVMGAKTVIESARIANAQNLTANSPVLNIDGLVFWVESSMQDKEVEVGDALSSWEDISPIGLDLSTTTGNPSYAESSVLRGLKSPYFDGNDSIESANFINALKYTVFVVANVESSGATYLYNNGDSGGWGLTVTNLGSFTNPAIIAVTNDSTGGVSGKVVRVNKSVTSTLTADNPASISGAFHVGSLGGSSGFFQGEIAEVIVFNRNLFDEERSEIENYLYKKYGIKD